MTPFGDASHDRKTEAGPIAARATSTEERFEDPVDFRSKDARSGIGDLEDDSIALTEQAQVHPTACRRMPKCVVDQVSDEYRQGSGFATYRGRLDPCETQVDRSVLGGRQQIGDHLLDDAVERA